MLSLTRLILRGMTVVCRFRVISPHLNPVQANLKGYRPLASQINLLHSSQTTFRVSPIRNLFPLIPCALYKTGLGNDRRFRQCETYTQDHKQNPFPSERFDGDAKEEPPQQLQIDKEIKDRGGDVFSCRAMPIHLRMQKALGRVSGSTRDNEGCAAFWAAHTCPRLGLIIIRSAPMRYR